MMNLFGSKKGKAAKSSKKGSRASLGGGNDSPAQPSWPSLSPAASMTLPGDVGKVSDLEASPRLESRTSDLIRSYAPPRNLVVRMPN
jgi:hypothetical protein